MLNSKTRFAFAVAAFLGLIGASGNANAADFYAGKTVTIVVGSDVGGGYDAYARLFSRVLAKFIPGHPSVLVQNMPGAGGATAAGYVYNVAPKDGTIIGATSPDVLAAPLFDQHPTTLYDPAKFIYLGSADNGARICVTSETSKIKNAADARSQTTIIGTAGTGSSSSDYAKLHKATSKLNFNIVAGYKGTGDILLAMERGEIDGFCGVDWSSFKSQRPNWVRDNKIHYLFRVGGKAAPDLDALGVHSVYDFVDDAEDRAVVELITAQQIFSRPYVLAPTVPAEEVTILRGAFSAAMQDPDFIKDAEKMGLALTPTSGDEVQTSVTGMYKAPQSVVARAKDILSH